jgi:hypothetical protein
MRRPARQRHPVNIADLHFSFIFCTLAGLGLSTLNRRLSIAARLMSATALILIVVALVSQISS